jgi:hypothetical protein
MQQIKWRSGAGPALQQRTQFIAMQYSVKFLPTKGSSTLEFPATLSGTTEYLFWGRDDQHSPAIKFYSLERVKRFYLRSIFHS